MELVDCFLPLYYKQVDRGKKFLGVNWKLILNICLIQPVNKCIDMLLGKRRGAVVQIGTEYLKNKIAFTSCFEDEYFCMKNMAVKKKVLPL